MPGPGPMFQVALCEVKEKKKTHHHKTVSLFLRDGLLFKPI